MMSMEFRTPLMLVLMHTPAVGSHSFALSFRSGADACDVDVEQAK